MGRIIQQPMMHLKRLFNPRISVSILALEGPVSMRVTMVSICGVQSGLRVRYSTFLVLLTASNLPPELARIKTTTCSLRAALRTTS